MVCSPEILEGGTASKASDVFAFGVILWELMTWQLPWGTSNPWSIVNRVTSNQRLPVPQKSEIPGPEGGSWRNLNRYVALMERCWAQNPGDRPDFEEIMSELKQMTSEA